MFILIANYYDNTKLIATYITLSLLIFSHITSAKFSDALKGETLTSLKIGALYIEKDKYLLIK